MCLDSDQIVSRQVRQSSIRQSWDHLKDPNLKKSFEFFNFCFVAFSDSKSRLGFMPMRYCWFKVEFYFFFYTYQLSGDLEVFVYRQLARGEFPSTN